MKLFAKPYIFLMVCWIILAAPTVSIPADISPSDGPSRIVLFISKNIRPYIEASDGIRDVLENSGLEVEVVILDKMGAISSEDMARQLAQEKDIALYIAIGPEAASFIWGSFKNDLPPKIYSLILNPEKVIGSDTGACGVALNIPARTQLEMIHNAFGTAKRVGVFYDPSNNAQFFLEAVEAAPDLGITMVPLQASSMKDIPFLLDEALKSVDCIWLIPDKTVISESIAQYIIKQAVIKRLPVVGYNQFFYESGAAMSFIFDYGALGRQTGELAGEIVFHHVTCNTPIPVFHVWLNGVVIEKLGIKITDPLNQPMMMGP